MPTKRNTEQKKVWKAVGKKASFPMALEKKRFKTNEMLKTAMKNCFKI